jgi:hypothetical protein
VKKGTGSPILKETLEEFCLLVHSVSSLALARTDYSFIILIFRYKKHIFHVKAFKDISSLSIFSSSCIISILEILS